MCHKKAMEPLKDFSRHLDSEARWGFLRNFRLMTDKDAVCQSLKPLKTPNLEIGSASRWFGADNENCFTLIQTRGETERQLGFVVIAQNQE